MVDSSLLQVSRPDDVLAGEGLPHMEPVADRGYLFPQPAVSKGSAFRASESLATSLSRWSPQSWGLGRSLPRPCRSPNLQNSSGCTPCVVDWGDWTPISALFCGFLWMCNISTFPVMWANRSCLTNNVSCAVMSPAVSSRPHSPTPTHLAVRIFTSSSSHGTSCVLRRGCSPTVFRTWTGVVMLSKGHLHDSGNTMFQITSRSWKYCGAPTATRQMSSSLFPPSLWTTPSRWQWPSATGTFDVTITSSVLPVRGKSASFSHAYSGNWSKSFWMVCQSSNAETQLGGASVMSFTRLPLTFCSHNISVFQVGDTLLPKEHRCNFSQTTFSSSSLTPTYPSISAKRCNHPQIVAAHSPNWRPLKSPGQMAWLAHSWAPVSWGFSHDQHANSGAKYQGRCLFAMCRFTISTTFLHSGHTCCLVFRRRMPFICCGCWLATVSSCPLTTSGGTSDTTFDTGTSTSPCDTSCGRSDLDWLVLTVIEMVLWDGGDGVRDRRTETVPGIIESWLRYCPSNVLTSSRSGCSVETWIPPLLSLPGSLHLLWPMAWLPCSVTPLLEFRTCLSPVPFIPIGMLLLLMVFPLSSPPIPLLRSPALPIINLWNTSSSPVCSPSTSSFMNSLRLASSTLNSLSPLLMPSLWSPVRLLKGHCPGPFWHETGVPTSPPLIVRHSLWTKIKTHPNISSRLWSPIFQCLPTTTPGHPSVHDSGRPVSNKTYALASLDSELTSPSVQIIKTVVWHTLASMTLGCRTTINYQNNKNSCVTYPSINDSGLPHNNPLSYIMVHYLHNCACQRG